jgi:serine/threonine-protein kinase HipA
MPRITLQVHHTGRWHDAALIDISDETAGIRSPSVIDYIMEYVVEWDYEGLRTGAPARDRRAISVAHPMEFTSWAKPTWPAFLLDMLPQGFARERLAQRLGFGNPRACRQLSQNMTQTSWTAARNVLASLS